MRRGSTSMSSSNPITKNWHPYTDTAVKEFTYFVTLYGPALSHRLNVVELPADTVPYAWAPEIAAIAGPSITEKTNYRLLANAIAHQWWGVSVSPAARTIGGLLTASPATPRPCTWKAPRARRA